MLKRRSLSLCSKLGISLLFFGVFVNGRTSVFMSTVYPLMRRLSRIKAMQLRQDVSDFRATAYRNVSGRASPPNYSTSGPSNRSAVYLHSEKRRRHQAKFSSISDISCVPFASSPFKNILIQLDSPRVNARFTLPHPLSGPPGFINTCRPILSRVHYAIQGFQNSSDVPSLKLFLLPMLTHPVPQSHCTPPRIFFRFWHSSDRCSYTLSALRGDKLLIRFFEVPCARRFTTAFSLVSTYCDCLADTGVRAVVKVLCNPSHLSLNTSATLNYWNVSALEYMFSSIHATFARYSWQCVVHIAIAKAKFAAETVN
ncbi:hypothetical protein B0H14DRAFT_2572369 [Mycena olivaceomarginata]|nr:hypothetical protein B0H14DRAFT_2572369 [Mycena olivaceomarginata]